MNKKFLFGMTAVLVLTGGYYASAATHWLFNPNYGYISPAQQAQLATETYAPGTPNWAVYPNSPYRVGGQLGPKAGQTWQQKFAPATSVATSGTSVSTSASSSQNTASSVTPTPNGSAGSSHNAPTTAAPASSSAAVSVSAANTHWPPAGTIPTGWIGHASWQNSIGGGQWTNPANANQFLNLTYQADLPAFYGTEWSRDWANPEWLLPSGVSYWQSDGSHIWAFVAPASGVFVTPGIGNQHPQSYGFFFEGQQYHGQDTLTEVSFQNATPTATGWQVLASWLPHTPNFLPATQ